MAADEQQDGAFQHADDAALRRELGYDRRPRTPAQDRGATVFIGYIRSQAGSQAEPRDDQEAWQQDTPPTAA